jgi:hypothetical protein
LNGKLENQLRRMWMWSWNWNWNLSCFSLHKVKYISNNFYLPIFVYSPHGRIRDRILFF